MAAAAAIEGTLFEQHGDTTQGTTVNRAFLVSTSHGAVRLSEPQPERLIGQPVTITDTNSTTLGVQGQARALYPEEHLQAAPALGPQTVLVLILTTPDDTEPATADIEQAREEVFTGPESAGAYYAQQSNGATTLVGRVDPAGDVLGPIALNTPIAGCPTGAIASEADERAAAAGYSPAAYDHVIYVLPPSGACTFAGLGDLPGRRVWSNGSLFVGVLAHELGHNMGAHHANLLSCTDSVGAATPYAASCTSTEYGDPFDVMGSGTALMGAFHRHQIGELPESRVLRLHQSATTPVVSSEDFTTPGPRLILVPIKHPHSAVSEYFAIDTRSPLAPFDRWNSGDPIATGLTIRKVTDLEYPVLQTQLIDIHPTEPVSDSALQPGETFSDAADGITITASGEAFSGPQVAVAMPTLTDDVPPSSPFSLSVATDSAGVHLAWSSATDNVAVDHYRVLRNGAEIGTTTGLTFDDPTLPSATVTYSVITVDTSGNESSPLSATLTFTRNANEERGEVLGFHASTTRRISIDTRLTRDGHGRLLIRVHCQAAAGRCTGTVQITTRAHGRSRRLGGARYDLRAGMTTNVPVSVVKQLAYLARRRVTLTLQAVATVVGGPTISQTCRLTPLARRHH